MKLAVLLAISLAAPLALGCAVDTSFPEHDEDSEGGEEAVHGDLCAFYGWYGDGICDDFCQQPDPDCEVDSGLGECLALCQSDIHEGCYEEGTAASCELLCAGFAAQGMAGDADVLDAVVSCLAAPLCYRQFSGCMGDELGGEEACHAICDSRGEGSCYAASVLEECHAHCDAGVEMTWHLGIVESCISAPLCYRTFEQCVSPNVP